MSNGMNQIRSALEASLQPPVEVMLDPSLLIASKTCERLADSTLFDAQTQATLVNTPTKPRIGTLHVPATFHELLDAAEHIDVPSTTAWNFYRGQADAASRADILDLLESHDVRIFGVETPTKLNWTAVFDEPEHQKRLIRTLAEERAFLADGGVLLSRTPTSLLTLRDAGVATIDLGQGELTTDFLDKSTDIGFRGPAEICGFGVTGAETTVDGLVGNLLADHDDLLLYRLGR